MAGLDSPAPVEKPVYLPPGVRPGELPPFHRLGEYIFQDLCRDLLDADPDVAHCDVYGLRGQSQKGIDLLAPLRGNAGHDVGQCKCYENLAAADVRAASNEFLKYWDHWSNLGLRRFILFVACEVSDRRVLDEITNQRRRFRERGAEYVVWAAPKLRNMLRPHPGLVASYFKPQEVWVREICGPDSSRALPTPLGRGTELRVAATENLLAQLAERLSGNTARQVEELRDAWREGRATEALEGVHLLKADTAVWSVLSPEAKAQVLRFEAGLVLDAPDGLVYARELAGEARRIAPADDHSRIDALIALKTHGTAAALKALGEPANNDARNLAGALLIDLGRAEEALALLDPDHDGFKASAETFRLQALAYAAAGDLERARLASQRALELAPRWEGVRSAAGIVEYLSALSPGAQPKGIPDWPQPPGWAYVQRDDESIARLRSAGERFASLCTSARGTAVEQNVYETWSLACLANDPERQEEAAFRCRTLLEADPTHPGAIAWALGRGYEFDRDAVEHALAALIENAGEELQAVTSLTMCLLGWDRPGDAARLLDSVKTRIKTDPAVEAWTFWRAQAALELGDDSVEQLLDGMDADERAQLELRGVRLRAERTGEWQALATALERQHLQTGYAPYLFEACLAWSRSGDWAAVAERADLLVTAVGTAEAVGLAAVAAHNSRRTELAVRLLDENRSRFPQSKLPHELRALRARALFALGELSEAIVEARDLAREQPILIHLMRLAQLLSMRGDLAELAAIARQIANREDLGAEDALRLARTIAVDDAALAARLWRLAMQRGVPDEAVAPALELAYRLGLEGETKPLMERMDRLARKGLHGHRIVKPAELPPLAEAWNREREQVVEAYRAGVVPVHLFADRIRAPLAVLYHHNLATHERDPRPASQFALRTYHGMRALSGVPSEPTAQWRLHADVTALLLAAHLGILERVEQSFGTIWIPASVIFDLARMRDELVPKQPKRLEHTREVAELADAGRITAVEFEQGERTPAMPWLAELGSSRAGMLVRAVAEDGYVLDFLPLRTSLTAAPPVLPEEFARRFVTPRAVVDALRQYGPLSRGEQRKALRELGPEGRGPVRSVLPEPGRLLFCHGNTADVLASAGVLRVACERFRVAVDMGTLRDIRAEHEIFGDRAADVRWLSELVEHLSQGESEGRYRIIPPSAVEVLDGTEEGDEDDELHGLLTVLRLMPQPGDVVWVDDRWSTGHWTRLGAPVVGIIEVLRAMLAQGLLGRDEYYDVLTRLRAANVRFVPITTRELVHHLLNADIDANGVVETRALKILRRYTSAWVLDAESLDRPSLEDGAPNPKSEMPLLVGLTRAVTDAILHVLVRGHVPRQTRLARARWIMESLYVDHVTVRRYAGLAGPDDDPRRLAAASAVGFILQGLSFGWNKGTRGRKLRRRYLNWVWRNVLRPRADADRLFFPLVAEILKNTPLFQLSGEDLPKVEQVVGLRMIVRDLPRRLRDELEGDPVFQTRLGIETVHVIAVEGVNIERTVFIRSAAEAVNGRIATAMIAGSEQTVRFEPHVEGSAGLAFRVTGVDGTRDLNIVEDIFGVLSESAAEREAVLRRNPDWYDGPGRGFDDWIAAVASTEDPVKRFLEAEGGRDGSPTTHYEQLLQQLRSKGAYRWNDLNPPPLERLLRYFRLDAVEGSGRDWLRALPTHSEALIADVGLEQALERWSGLPVPLPTAFGAAVARLDRVSRRKLVKRLLRTAGSPVSDLHLVRLLWNLRDVEPGFGQLAQRRARHLMNGENERSRFETFRTMLRWVGEEFALRPEAVALPSHLRLALVWLHAHRLFGLFTAAHADMGRLGAHFRATRHRLSSREFSDDPAYQQDAAVPGRLERLPFLLGGLIHAFAGATEGEIGNQLLHAVEEVFFLDSNGTRVPHVTLLRDSSRAGNSLGSFLHRRRTRELRALVHPERVGLLSSRGLREFARVLLENPRPTGGSPELWVHIWAVMGDLPQPRDLEEGLAGVIRTTDFRALVFNEPAMGGFALRAAAAAAAHHPDPEVREIVRNAVLAVASDLGARDPHASGDLLAQDGGVSAAPHLAQAAVELTKRPGRRSDRLAELAELLSAVISTWPALAEGIGGFAQRAWEELPSWEARFFGDVAIRARALK